MTFLWRVCLDSHREGEREVGGRERQEEKKEGGREGGTKERKRERERERDWLRGASGISV
jgi:hypothetical protein